MLDIYVPSYKRKNAPLIKKLIDAKLPFTIVLDHEQDMIDYAPLESDTVSILYIEKALGIGYIRQCIKDRYNGVPVIMLDDDTQLRLRKFDNPTRLDSCTTPAQTIKWFRHIDRFCQNNRFDIGSAAESFTNYMITDKVLKKGTLCSVTIFNSERCREIDYDPKLYKRMEDCDIVLQAITRHFDFLIDNEVLRHCPMNKEANDVGGCSEVYQNDLVMHQTTQYLIKKWGEDIIKLRKNKRIGNYYDFTVDYALFRKRYGYDY